MEEIGQHPAVPFESKVALEKVRISDTHDTGSAEKWKEYSTRKISDMVHELFEKDLKTFGHEKADFSVAENVQRAY